MKNIFILIAIAGSLVAQNTGQNVVTQVVLASAARSVDATFNSSTVQNIGQTNHTIVMNVTANTLVANAVTLSCVIQASLDGTNWQSIGNTTTFLVDIFTLGQLRCYGYGSYPYIRTQILLQRTNGGALTFSASYIGTSVPVNNLIDYGSNISPLVNTSGALVKSAVRTSLLSAGATQSVNIYGMSLSSDATGTVLVFDCTAGQAAFQLDAIGTARFMNFPVGLRPLISCGLGQTFSYTLTGTPNVTLNVAYRVE